MILTHNQLALENSLRRILPAGVVSCWIPDGYDKIKDIIGGNHGRCFGTHPNVPIIGGFPIEQLNACDMVPGWVASAGGSLSIDTSDKKEGIGSLRNTIAAPAADTYYDTKWYPSDGGILTAKKHILVRLICDRPNTAFTFAYIAVFDTSGNYRYWHLDFSAGEWGAFKFLLSTGDAESGTPPDLASIARIVISFKTKDTTPFYKKIDDLRVTGYSSLVYPSVGHVFGGDDYIRVPEDDSWKITGEMTIGSVVFPTAPPGAKGNLVASVWRYHATPALNRGWNFGNNNNTDSFWLNLRASSGTLSQAAYSNFYAENLHKWTFVVGTFKPSQYVCLYINKVKVDEDTSSVISAIAYADGIPLGIGSRGDSAQGYWDGNIALLFLAKKTWSQQEVENFGNAIKSLFSPRGF